MAFLLRHDYVVYVVASSVVLLVVQHWTSPSAAVRQVATYAGVALVLVLPWLLFVQAHEGLGPYVSAAVRFAGSEGRRTASGQASPVAYGLMLVPLAGLVLSRRPSPLVPSASLAAASTLVLLMSVVFLRDVLSARLPDVRGGRVRGGHLPDVLGPRRHRRRGPTKALSRSCRIIPAGSSPSR